MRLVQVFMQGGARLLKGDLDGGFLAQRVKQAVVVDHAVVARHGYRDAGRVQLASEGFAFVTQNVQFSRLNQRGGEPFQLLSAGAKRRGEHVVTIFRARGVIILSLIHI